MPQSIEQLIYQAIDHHPEITISKGPDTPLIGPGSGLDSIALVSLVIDIEQLLNDHYHTEIALMDEKAFSLTHSPFRTIATLADHTRTLLTDAHVPG